MLSERARVAREQMLWDDIAAYAKVAVWTSLIGVVAYALTRFALFAMTVGHIAN